MYNGQLFRDEIGFKMHDCLSPQSVFFPSGDVMGYITDIPEDDVSSTITSKQRGAAVTNRWLSGRFKERSLVKLASRTLTPSQEKDLDPFFLLEKD